MAHGFAGFTNYVNLFSEPALASVLVLLVESSNPSLADDIVGLFGWVGLPVDGNLFIALVLAVLGGALRRRKRTALSVLLLWEVLGLVVGLVYQVLEAIDPSLVGMDTPPGIDWPEPGSDPVQAVTSCKPWPSCSG